MRSCSKVRNWTILLAAALLILAGCGDDDPDTSNDDGDAAIHDADNDAGPGDDAEDGGDDDGPDGGDEDGGDQPDLTDLELDGATEMVRGADNWTFTAASADESQFFEMRLDLDSAEGDSVDLQSVDALAADNSWALVLDDDSFYLTNSGTVDIETFEKQNGGQFEATLGDATFEEVDVSQDGQVSSVSEGRTGQLDQEDLSAEVLVFEASCDSEGFEAAEDARQIQLSEGVISASFASNAVEPADILTLTLRQPAEQTFALDEYRFSRCTTCLVLHEQCLAGENGNECETSYVAGEGEIEVAQVGGEGQPFEATIRDAVLAEADIDGGETTLVEDGAGWCIDEFTFEGTIE